MERDECSMINFFELKNNLKVLLVLFLITVNKDYGKIIFGIKKKYED